MRTICIFITVLFLFSCASGKEKAYTGSTPAAPVVRDFLGIPLSDSIDFIRWDLKLDGDHYSLQCKYGTGKPNTKEFINGGEKISVSGTWKKENNKVRILNGNKQLGLAELNNNLLHLLDAHDHLLVGGGGWGYTLNNLSPSVSDEYSLKPGLPVIKDSVTFHGRTPCGIPGVVEEGKQCYRLKWSIALFSEAGKNESGTYRARGTAMRQYEGVKGNWKIITGKNGRLTYQLDDANGKPYIFLLILDNNIVLFTDAKGNLLVGDGDFSYSLNRKAVKSE